MGDMTDLVLAQDAAVEGGLFDRAQGVGGSDVAAILGISPFRSEWDVWLEKTRDPSWRPQEESPEMRFGKMVEPVILDYYSLETGADVHSPGVKWHPNGLIFSHIDGWAIHNITDAGVGIVEAKAPRDDRDWPGKPPMYYETQARTYLSVYPEAEWLDFAVLFRQDARYQTLRLERDRRLEDRIVRMVDEWWEKRVVRGEPPPVDGTTGASSYIAKRWPAPETEDLLPYDADFEKAILAYMEVSAALKRHDESKQRLRNIIAAAFGPYARAQGIGWRASFNAVKGATTTDWKEAAAAFRALIEQARAEPRRVAALKQLAEVDLDAIVSTYTRTAEGHRSLIVKEDK